MKFNKKLLAGILLSAISLLGPISALAQCTTTSFQAVINVDAGTLPNDMAAGDFNADGRTDFAVTNFNNEVYIVLGNAIGPPTISKLTSINKPFTVGTGDFNRDTKPDLAISHENPDGSDAVAILLGNGTGAFGAPTDFPTTNERPLLVADFNNDGNSDVLVGNTSGGVSQLLLGNGTGGLSGAANKSIVFTENAIAADFNKDSKLDVAVATDGPFIAVYLGDGAGNFGAIKTFDVNRAKYLATADFNGDNNLDVVTTGEIGGFSILLGDGTGNFGSATIVPISVMPTVIAAADFNEDGKTDVALEASAAIFVFLGNGNGSFGEPMGYPTGDSARDIATGDFNGDNNLDITTMNTLGASLIFGDGAGALRIATGVFAGEGSFAIASGDLNNDGHDDLVFTNLLQNNVSVQIGNGNGGFTPAGSFPVGIGSNKVALGDLNGDQKLDVVTANFNSGTVSVLLGDGLGALGPANHVAVPGFNPRDVVIGDLNNDGKSDLAISYLNTTSISILPGDGSGGFGPPANFAVPTGGQELAISDLNRDGLPDLAVATNNGLAVLLGNNATGFSPANTLPTPSNAVVIADFNGDGKFDLASARSNVNIINVYLGDGLGGFSQPTSFPAPGPIAMAAADFNADGVTDLVTANSQNRASVFLGNGTGGFAPYVTYFGVGATPTRTLTTGDFNSDQRPDIAFADLSGINSIILNTCSATPVSMPALSIGNVTIGEGDSGNTNATFNVNLSAASAKTVVVSFYTAARDTTKDVDYQTRTGVLTFAPGVTSQTITVPITGDTIDEFDEQFDVRLAFPLNASINVGQGQATIIDNDLPPSISINDVSVNEGDTGTTPASFTLSLSAPSGKPISVSAATSAGSATAGVDYQSLNQIITVAAGQTSFTFSIAVVGDGFKEPDETFSVSLSNPVNVTIADAQGAGTILNDDNLEMILDESGPAANQAAAIDSILFIRDPFRVQRNHEWLNLGSDRRTRLVVFAANMNQNATAANVVISLTGANNQTYEIQAEDVRAVPNQNFTQIIFALPESLVSGVCTVTIKAQGKVSNTTTIRIAP